MWDLPRLGLEPVSPALAGGFLTTAPPGKPPNVLLPYDLTIVLLGIYPRELKRRPYKNLHPGVYSSFFHNCRNLEMTKMSFSRWMGKLWYIETMEYYLALKRNELLSLENTMLSKISQTQQDKYCMIPLTWNIWTRQIHRDREQTKDYQGLRGGENRELLLNWHRISVWDDEKF